ncbi:MAG TPA: FecR family protein [Sphingopyxis sp.]|nr:FecR family protein [Sphingopyxis sp.]
MTAKPSALSLRGLAPDEAAAAWMVRMDTSTLAPDEQAAFDAWRAESEANAAAFARAKAAWSLFDDVQGDPALDALRVSALAAGREPRRGLWLGAGVGIAASLLAVLLFQGNILTPPPAGDGQRIAVQSPPEAARSAQQNTNGEFVTARGERRTVRLADGSTITLNTDSRIRVGYGADRRLIRLIKGQALFEVARDAHRPFVVQVGNRQVTALGTVFEVRFDADRVKVTLVEGKVVVDEVEDRPDRNGPIMVPTVLAPGQALVTVDGARPRLTKVDVDQQLRWREGFVEFEDATLAEAVAEMNRYAGKQLVIADPRVGDLRVSGVFRTGSPDRFAAIVGELLPVRQHPLPDGTVELHAAGR